MFLQRPGGGGETTLGCPDGPGSGPGRVTPGSVNWKSFMAGVEEQSRRRIGLMLLLAGGALALGGAAVIFYQQHLVQTSAPLHPPSVVTDRIPTAQIIQKVLFLLLTLVLAFCVASLAFLRFSRRFRQWLFHKPAPPTPADDVWSMHRLPPELDPGGAGDPAADAGEPDTT